LENELSRVPGVGEVTRFGGEDPGLRIWLDPEQLAARNVTANDVIKALREHKAERPAEQKFPLTPAAEGRLLDERWANLVLRTGPHGSLVRLRDVARLELGAGRSRGEARLDGRPVVALGISPTPGAQFRDVGAAVRDRMERLKKQFPDGLDYTIAFDLAVK